MMNRYRFFLCLLSLALALAPAAAGASASHTFDAGMEGWGPNGAETDCVWVSGTGYGAPGALRAGLSCLSPAYGKSAGSGVSGTFWTDGPWAGWAGFVWFVVGGQQVCHQNIWSEWNTPGSWDQQTISCSDPVLVDAVQFHLLIGASSQFYADDFTLTGATAATPTPAATATTAPVIATLTPTPTPFLIRATPTPVPTQPPLDTPTPLPRPVIPSPPAPAPAAPGEMDWHVGGGSLMPWASQFLSDWSAIIVPAGLAALTGIALVKVGDFMRR